MLASNHGSWTMLIKSKLFYSVHIKFKLQPLETYRNNVLTLILQSWILLGIAILQQQSRENAEAFRSLAILSWSRHCAMNWILNFGSAVFRGCCVCCSQRVTGIIFVHKKVNLNLHCCWRENWKTEGHPYYLRDPLQLSVGCFPRGQNEELVGEGQESLKQRFGLILNNSYTHPPPHSTHSRIIYCWWCADLEQRNICLLCMMLRRSYFCCIIIQCHKYTRRHWKIKTQNIKYTIRKQVDVSQGKRKI